MPYPRPGQLSPTHRPGCEGEAGRLQRDGGAGDEGLVHIDDHDAVDQKLAALAGDLEGRTGGRDEGSAGIGRW